MTHEQRAQMLELAERCDRRSDFDTAESPYRLLKEAATALRLAAQSASPAATPQEVQEACAQVADRTALRCVREQIPGDSVAIFIAKAIRALIPPAQPVAWLIEWPETDNAPVRWWNPAHGWMRDANAALHFARKTDADCYLSTMKFGEHLVVTEHMCVSHATPAAPQSVREPKT